MTAPTLTWRSHEHAHAQTPDWFWSLGIIAVTGAIAAILLHNSLFALLIVLGAFTLGISTNREGRELAYSLSTRGVTIGETLYPFKALNSFYINETDPAGAVLLIDAAQLFTPHLIIPLPETVDRNAIQDFLLDYLPEEELHESPTHKLFELLGF